MERRTFTKNLLAPGRTISPIESGIFRWRSDNYICVTLTDIPVLPPLQLGSWAILGLEYHFKEP
jgi:hypothetical protein